MDDDEAGGHLEFRVANCAPGTKANGASCYPDEIILEMAGIWNDRHPSNQIVSSSPREAWIALRKNLSSSCQNERCWAVKLLGERRRKELIPRLFVPLASASWCKKPQTWLDSVDISKVMAQYESAFSSFKFFGPAPIDFAGKDEEGRLVWPELADIQVSDLLKSGHLCSGYIFNTRPHTSDGEHWISMFMDLRGPEPSITFSDSNGTPPPKQVMTLIKKLKSQYSETPETSGKLSVLQNKIRHQQGNTECGIYCLHMIISLLENRMQAKDYLIDKKPDAAMAQLRDRLFVKQCRSE